MRNYDPNSESDKKDLAELNAEPWMVECFKLNPNYTCWGPGEDYMPSPHGKSNDRGWASSQEFPTWSDFGPWTLDDLNVLPHFYFEVVRASVNCEACDSSGYNPATKQIADDFYDFTGAGRRWCDNITQDEVDALIAEGRLKVRGNGAWESRALTAAEVNAANRTPGLGDLHHDAINRWILIETRAKRLGVYGKCDACGGNGYVYTEPAAKLGLVLWVLHPRNGAARGVRILDIRQDDLPKVLRFLADAAEQNAMRFGAVRREFRRATGAP